MDDAYGIMPPSPESRHRINTYYCSTGKDNMNKPG